MTSGSPTNAAHCGLGRSQSYYTLQNPEEYRGYTRNLGRGGSRTMTGTAVQCWYGP